MDDWADRLDLFGQLSERGVRSGDSLIAVHDHNCAADCSAHAEDFLHGVQLG